MAKGKRTGKAHEAGYARYKNSGTETKNRLANLQKVAKAQPNNEQIALAIKNIHHRRKLPKAPYWSHQMIAMAKIVKYFSGKFDKGYFSPDPKAHAAAVSSTNAPVSELNTPKVQGSMFSMKERAKWLS